MSASVVSLPDDAGLGLTTERLVLRRFVPADLPWLTALYADEEVVRHIGGAKTAEQARQMLESRILRYYDEHPGLGVWLTSKRDDAEPIGFHLLNHIQGEQEMIQVGYTLLKPHWGQGYATEMCRGLLRYAAEKRGLTTLLAIVSPDNPASRRVLVKSGLRHRGRRFFAHPAYAPGDLDYFERDAGEWLAEHRAFQNSATNSNPA